MPKSNDSIYNRRSNGTKLCRNDHKDMLRLVINWIECLAIYIRYHIHPELYHFENVFHCKQQIKETSMLLLCIAWIHIFNAISLSRSFSLNRAVIPVNLCKNMNRAYVVTTEETIGLTTKTDLWPNSEQNKSNALIP